MAIEAPGDFDEKITLLPDDQYPFGVDCLIAPGIQSVLFHYRISAMEVDGLVSEEFFTKRDFRLASPDGNDEERAVFLSSVAPIFPKAVRCLRMKSCFRRILADCPLDAVSPPPPPPPPPPPKRKAPNCASDAPRKSGSASASVGRRGASAPASTSTGKSSVQLASTSTGKSSGKSAAGSSRASVATPVGSASKSSAEYDDVSDDDDDDADASLVGDPDLDGSATDGEKTSGSNRKDLASLFHDVADEVWWCFPCGTVFSSLLCFHLSCLVVQPHVLFPQRIRSLKDELVSKCRIRMKVDDDGTGYSSLLELLQQLRDAVKPSRFQGRLLERAALLESALQGVVDVAEVFARQKEAGLAKILYAEFSGHAGMPIFNRLNKAFAAASTTAAVRRSAPLPYRGGSSGRRGNSGTSRGGGLNRTLNGVQCHGCKKFGHFRSHCPDEAAART